MTEGILNFVNSRVSTQTPSEIYQNLQPSELVCTEHLVQHQVYYQGKQANKIIGDTMMISSYLQNNYSKNLAIDTTTNNFSRLTFVTWEYMFVLQIEDLSKSTKVVAIDATFGTNNAGMDLYDALAELDETGVSPAYLFIEKDN